MRKRFRTPDREEILSGPPLRTMARIGLPAVLSSVVFSLYNFADAFWLGRRPEAGAAASAGIQISWLFVWAIISFVTGFGGAAVTALVAQHLGAGQPREANYAMNQLLTVSAIAGFVVGAVGYALLPQIVSLLIPEASVAAEASTYLSRHPPAGDSASVGLGTRVPAGTSIGRDLVRHGLVERDLRSGRSRPSRRETLAAPPHQSQGASRTPC